MFRRDFLGTIVAAIGATAAMFTPYPLAAKCAKAKPKEVGAVGNVDVRYVLRWRPGECHEWTVGMYGIRKGDKFIMYEKYTDNLGDTRMGTRIPEDPRKIFIAQSDAYVDRAASCWCVQATCVPVKDE